jgi:predicted DNA-binding transcriptional regulator AlpA
MDRDVQDPVSVKRGDPMSDRLLDIEELSKYLKIKTKTIRNKLSDGTWPMRPLRIGRALRWRESDVKRVIAKLAHSSERAPWRDDDQRVGAESIRSVPPPGAQKVSR